MAVHPVARVVEREARVYRRLWRSLAFTSFVQPVLYLAAMGIALGDLVDDNAGPVEGLSYLEFIAPGLLAAIAAQMGAVEGLWPVMAGMKWVRFYHGMVSAPIRARDVYGGFVIWQALRTTFTASVFLAVAAALGAVPSLWGLLAVPAASLCAVAIATLIAAFSATQESDTAFPVIMRLVILPLFLFSGAFFPIGQLPGWLAAAARASPLYHGVELARAATTGDFDATVFAHVGVLLGLVALGTAVGVSTFSRRLTS